MSNTKYNKVPALPHNPFSDMPGVAITSKKLPIELKNLAHVRVYDAFSAHDIAKITELHVCFEIRRLLSDEVHARLRGTQGRFNINPMDLYDCECGDSHAPTAF